MLPTNRKYDRMAMRLSALITRLMAGESLVLSCLAQEFNVSERTLQRDLRERLAYLGRRSARLLSLTHQYAKSLSRQRCSYLCETDWNDSIVSGLDSRLLGLLLTQQPHAPYLIWHHAHQTSAEHAEHFYQLVYAIIGYQHITLPY